MRIKLFYILLISSTHIIQPMENVPHLLHNLSKINSKKVITFQQIRLKHNLKRTSLNTFFENKPTHTYTNKHNFLIHKKSTQKLFEHTFAMIKPDAVRAKHVGNIINLIEKHNFDVVHMQKKHFSKKQAKVFYYVHVDKPFFNELVNFITSGPVIIMALKHNNAIQKWRDVMGATDPTQADEGTIRKLYGTHIGSNAVHGSDGPKAANYELGLFFPELKDVNK